MKCVTCGKSPHSHGITLIRQNPKGEEGIWSCESCNRIPVEQDLADVLANIQKATNPKEVLY